MLDYILQNALYRINCKSGNTYIGNIDDVSNQFGNEEVISLYRLPSEKQPNDLKDFFVALEKYEKEVDDHVMMENFYPIYAKTKNNS